MAANLAVFALESLWGGSESSPTLYRMGANAGREALLAQPWRALSSAFLHIGFLHLLLNMWALVVFGRGLEHLLGAGRLLVLYGLSALGGGLFSSLGREQALSAGASGAVWGLMVAELVLLLRPRALFADLEFAVSKWTVLQPLVLNLVYSLQPGIDLLGHLGGGLTGALVMGSGLLARRPGSRSWAVAGAVGAVLMAASITLALAHGRPWELRAPVLEMRPLLAGSIQVPVPRGLGLEQSGGELVFGNLRRDPLAVECEPQALAEPVGDLRGVIAQIVRQASAEPLPSGARREQGPEVVDLAGRPAFHQAVRYDNGARADHWYTIHGRRALRLVVVTRPDAPEAWRSLPVRIANGVVFAADGASVR